MPIWFPELWPLPFDVNVKLWLLSCQFKFTLWPLQSHSSLGTVATRVRFELQAFAFQAPLRIQSHSSFESCGRHRSDSIWELWPLPFHLKFELWSLHYHLRFRAVATTLPYDFDALAAAVPFGFEALAATILYEFGICGNYRPLWIGSGRC